MGKRAEQKKKTCRRIVKKAMKVFAQKGFAAARTLDVAEAAGVAHGTVFVHFPTREELVAAAVKEFTWVLKNRIQELVEKGAGVREVLSAHIAGLAEHERFYTRMVEERRLLPEKARMTLLGIHSVISAYLAEAAEQEIGQGSLRPVPMHLMFNTWLGLVHYYLSNRDLFAPKGSVLSRWGEDLIDYYMGLLSP